MKAVNLSLLPLLLGKLLIVSPIGKQLTSALTRSMEEGALQRLKTRNALLQFVGACCGADCIPSVRFLCRSSCFAA